MLDLVIFVKQVAGGAINPTINWPVSLLITSIELGWQIYAAASKRLSFPGILQKWPAVVNIIDQLALLKLFIIVTLYGNYVLAIATCISTRLHVALTSTFQWGLQFDRLTDWLIQIHLRFRRYKKRFTLTFVIIDWSISEMKLMSCLIAKLWKRACIEIILRQWDINRNLINRRNEFDGDFIKKYLCKQSGVSFRKIVTEMSRWEWRMKKISVEALLIYFRQPGKILWEAC